MADTRQDETQDQPLFAERSITITVTALAEGWPLTIAFTGYTVDQVLRSLKAKGLRPAHTREGPQDATGSLQTNGSAAAVAAGSPPLCPDHGTPMRQGKYGWYCSRKDGDTYCSRKA